MKMTRSDLKQLVKECLVEVLSESLGVKSQKNVQTNNVPSSLTQLSQAKFANNNKALDTRIKEQKKPIIESIVKTGDPIMDAIFADTAKTTLPTLVEAEGMRTPPSQGLAEKIVANTNPENLFGEDAAAKWASLAFGDFSKKV